MNKTEFKIRVITCLVSAILCVMTAYDYKSQCKESNVVKKGKEIFVAKMTVKKKM